MIFTKFPDKFCDYLKEKYPPCDCEKKKNLIKNILKNIIFSIVQSGEKNYIYFDYIVNYFYSEKHIFYYPQFKLKNTDVSWCDIEYVEIDGINNLSVREELFNIFNEIIRYHKYVQDKENKPDYTFYSGDKEFFYYGQSISECREMHRKKAMLYYKIFFDIIIPKYVTCFLSYETSVDSTIFCLDKYNVKLELDVLNDIVEYSGLNYEGLRKNIEESNKRTENMKLW